MKTQIELDNRFDYPDDKETTKEFQKFLIAIPFIWITLVTMILLCISNADAIDRFFGNIIKSIF